MKRTVTFEKVGNAQLRVLHKKSCIKEIRTKQSNSSTVCGPKKGHVIFNIKVRIYEILAGMFDFRNVKKQTKI